MASTEAQKSGAGKNAGDLMCFEAEARLRRHDPGNGRGPDHPLIQADIIFTRHIVMCIYFVVIWLIWSILFKY